MTKVLLINTNCSWNSGSAAQVICTVDLLREKIANLNFTLLSDTSFRIDFGQCRKHDIRVIGPTREKPFARITYLLRLFELANNLFECTSWTFLSKLGINPTRFVKGITIKEYVDSDLIIDLSGDTLSDRGARSIFALSRMLMAIILKKKIVVYSQSIGPFSRFMDPIAKFCLKRADLIVIRETETLSILKEMGINNRKLHLAPDVAFLLEPVSEEEAGKVLCKEGINKSNSPLVGLGTNELVSKALKLSKESYVSLMANIADFLVEKIGFEVVLTPSVIVPSEYCFRDDRFVAHQIYEAARNRDRIRLLCNEYSPEELKGIIGQFDLFIGARMHTNIFATSMHVPTVGLGWSHKYFGIMKMIGQEQYVCDFSSINFDQIVEKTIIAWSNRDRIRDELAVRIPELCRSVRRTSELIKDLLEEK